MLDCRTVFKHLVESIPASQKLILQQFGTLTTLVCAYVSTMYASTVYASMGGGLILEDVVCSLPQAFSGGTHRRS